MFTQVAELFHDLDAGMLPVSVLFPYLPIPQHRRRDRCGPEPPLYRPGCSTLRRDMKIMSQRY